MNRYEIETEEYGTITLTMKAKYFDEWGDYFIATDENGNKLGKVYDQNLDENERYNSKYLELVLADMIDDGSLKEPSTKEI